MNFQTIAIDRDGRGITTLRLARAEKHNALSAQMMDELTEAAGMLGSDPDTRAVILTGTGPSFCAGGDLGWMREQLGADGPARRAAARKLAMMLNALNEMPRPLIGKVQGNAFGGGIGMISVCDVAFGAQGARFGLTETRLGLIPATIGPYVIARMGEGRARRVFMSARIFDADEAMRLDLLAGVHAPGELDAVALAEAEAYLQTAPGAVGAAKRLARRLGPRIDPDVIEISMDALVDAWDAPEAAEGIAAFFDRRKPGWQA